MAFYILKRKGTVGPWQTVMNEKTKPLRPAVFKTREGAVHSAVYLIGKATLEQSHEHFKVVEEINRLRGGNYDG